MHCINNSCAQIGTVSFTKSSQSTFFKPRFHVLLTNADGNVEEVFHDATLLQAAFLARYHEAQGWTITR